MLNVHPTSGIEWFEADEPGIVKLKAEFAEEADEFLYLRKGEDIGSLDIACLLAHINMLTDGSLHTSLDEMRQWVQFGTNLLTFVPVMGMVYKRAKDFWLKRQWSGRKPRKLLLLLSPDNANREALPIYRAQGYEVRQYSQPSEKGKHRFYLNDKRFAVFLRRPDKTFIGLMGTDEKIRGELRRLFESEWYSSLEIQ